MKRTDSLTIHAFGLTLTSLALLASLATLVRNMPIAARRAIKPLALWLNAERYKASEEEIDYLRGTQRRLHYLARESGRDAGYYAQYRLHLSAKEHRELVLQRKLRANRDWINQW